ncbi:MAG: potassium-transporting ATPase subunit KdpC [Methylovulum sp.]
MPGVIKPALTMLLCFTVLTGVVYPLLVTFSAQVFFPTQANGSLLIANEQPQGSELIGQYFSRPEYFWGRPSATSPNPYNAAASGGSNYGPTNPALIAAVKDRIQALHAAGPRQQQLIPADLVTASASGLDPHISPGAAQFQINRIATARDLPPAKVAELVEQFTEARQFGVLGEPRVNVLKLNLALDNRFK